MILTPTNINVSALPDDLRKFIKKAPLFDSSCSAEARVIFIDKDTGYFLKTAAKGRLKKEAEMTKYFHGKGLSAPVITYISSDMDYLLTEKIQGDDCTAAKYLEQPELLCDTIAVRLAMLHSLDFSDCPIQNHTGNYIVRAKENFASGWYNKDLFPDNWGYENAEKAIEAINSKSYLLQTDTLLHGDYCLPNIILNDWCFSGFIDLDSGGVGDKNVDIFWGIWTLFYNLKTNKYRERFIDAYGRENVDEERLRVVAACEVFL